MAKYKVLPKKGISPYLDTKRFKKPKEIFKHSIDILNKLNFKKKKSLVDISCANGEFLYLLKKKFKNWDFTGIDICKEYIEVAKSHNELIDIKFIHKNFMSINTKWDIVFMHGSLQTQKDFEPWINKLLKIVNKNGYIFITSYFNPYDVDMKIEFCDNSNDMTKGIWRSDYNFHSQFSVSKFLKKKCKSFKFFKIPMNVEIKRSKKMPHINSWTLKDIKGNNILTNGMKLILDDYLLLIKK
jgi:SAM-dependent methyltransferase